MRARHAFWTRTGFTILSAFSAVLLAGFALAGCGSSHAPTAAPTPTPTPAPSRSVTPGAPITPAPGGPVPSGLRATSVTFVSTQEAFVLGAAPCSSAVCTSIVRTLDRGASWRGLPAPVVPLSPPGGTGVWGIRFATPEHGFVFGDGLWETTDGGQLWGSAAYPGGSILSLAAIDGQVLALTATCSVQAGCAQPGTLWRRPLAGGAWSKVTQVHTAGITDATDMIATQAGVAAVLDGNDVVVTSDGGITFARHSTPCTTTTMMQESSVAVIAPDGLALLCTGQGYTGHTAKTVYTSGDLGATWVRTGVPGAAGDGGTIAAANPSQLVIATASAASWLYYSGDGAARWQTMYTEPDGGQGWADLGFTTASDGVVIHGPAARGFVGQLMLTEDGGLTWRNVGF
jgi:hypothetical protein